ncbi:hypothetical protein D3C72_1633420 [compost metagenome]
MGIPGNAHLCQPPGVDPRAVACQRIGIVPAADAQALPQRRGVQVVAIDEQKRFVRYGGGRDLARKSGRFNADDAAHQVGPRVQRPIGHFAAMAVRHHQAGADAVEHSTEGVQCRVVVA